MWFDELSTRLPTVNIFPLIPGEKAGPTVLNRVDSPHTIERCHEASEVPNLRGVQLDVSGVDHVRPRSLRNSGAAVSTLLVIAPVPVAGYALMSILEPAHRMPLIEQMRGSGAGQKRRIGQAAARLTDDHSTVLILGGTTDRVNAAVPWIRPRTHGFKRQPQGCSSSVSAPEYRHHRSRGISATVRNAAVGATD